MPININQFLELLDNYQDSNEKITFIRMNHASVLNITDYITIILQKFKKDKYKTQIIYIFKTYFDSINKLYSVLPLFEMKERYNILVITDSPNIVITVIDVVYLAELCGSRVLSFYKHIVDIPKNREYINNNLK